jgi:hypothetical protein
VVRKCSLALLLFGGCAGTDSKPREAVSVLGEAPDTAHPWRKPGDKIDSILPMEEYLRRFRVGLAEPAGLTGGAASATVLAQRFLAAVAARDTAAFLDLVVSRAEFAWLIFPDHIYAPPPYELDPEIFWLQLTAGSAKGLGRTLQRFGGTPLTFLSLSCQRDTLQVRRGPVKLFRTCDLRYRTRDSVETGRLFGSIVERNGRAKLLSLANDF